ncbi:alcohol dehydrogenase [Vulcanimicrobium alpinum]|uniref:alcohol dehydrogenase n=1 Tax=Vulcanimicrobium alpinum TaxID=3016050 RepID=A0AAN1XY38_UNVUL|nr:zinc-binding alcohol dehydrogenase family protein [Vulcanimicrobium alpinum]BDE07489.1 alcohol dehydrogenase [Vulcanimicrobium alpinum]
MRAAVYDASRHALDVVERDVPAPQPGELLLRVRACGVCRTDLHIVDAELPARLPHVVPGHQIVGEVAGGATPERPLGMRVGVSWIASTDGTCAYCTSDRENLCDAIRFTGYDRDGGFAQYALARADFTYPLDKRLVDAHAAPLLCAGIIGFRALRVAGVERGERVGLYGFGASAHLMVPVLRAWDCSVYVATRGDAHRAFARRLGVDWTGDAADRPPHALDRAVTFAPSGDVVVAALGALRKGGVVAINAIHLDRIPAFDYDALLWGERQIRSVANMTRDDAHAFLDMAARIGLRPQATVYPLDRVADALAAIRLDEVDGAAVIVP